MYFWLKFFHITAMAVWFTGLFFMPRLFIARARGARASGGATLAEDADSSDHVELSAIGRTLYFGIMTPAAVVTVVLGLILIAYGFQGPWLPAKLALVALAVLLHVYLGQLLLDLGRNHASHGVFVYRLLNWIPLLLFLGIAALVAAKPGALPPLGGV